MFTGKPQSVQNCTLTNETSSSVEVKCHPGYNGGLPQVFILEVYTPYSSSPICNLTEKEYPIFYLSNLQPDVILKICVSAVNSKGRSQAVVLEELRFKNPEKRTGIIMTLSIVFRGRNNVYISCRLYSGQSKYQKYVTGVRYRCRNASGRDPINSVNFPQYLAIS